MSYAIQIEIQTCTAPNTIFRGNSLASKMFKTYSRLTSVPYLFKTIAQFIQPLEALQNKAKSKKSDKVDMDLMEVNIELDANKGANAEAIEANAYQLQYICNRILNAIFKSKDSIPYEFKKLFCLIKEEINNKFEDEDPNTIYYAVGGLFFLRFVVPAITAPHVYGLLPNPPSENTQRQLVLIGKVIQSIGNMVLPGKKEDFMVMMSDYVEGSIPKVREFYESIMLPVLDQPPRENVEIPAPIKLNALSTLYTIYVGRIKQIKEQMEALQGVLGIDAGPYIRKLDIIVQTYGEGVAKKKKKKKE